VKLMTDFNNRLFDRFGSAKEFNDLLQSEGGARLIAALTAEHGSTGARDRILRATQTGVVFVVLGVGFLLLDWRFTFNDREAFIVIGVIALSIGIGLLLSSVASYWVAKTLRVLDTTDSYADGRRPTQ
jgi:drug/metabolite transporter (DMT)-like permease